MTSTRLSERTVCLRTTRSAMSEPLVQDRLRVPVEQQYEGRGDGQKDCRGQSQSRIAIVTKPIHEAPPPISADQTALAIVHFRARSGVKNRNVKQIKCSVPTIARTRI